MKKIFTIVSAFLTFSLHTGAQPTIEKSEVFEDPGKDGWRKVLVLKNGNTFYFHYGGGEGINVFIAGKDRKKITSKIVESKLWNSKRDGKVDMRGIYEINGEPVIFLTYFEHEAHVLYRLRINPATGALVKEEKIGTTPRNTRMRSMGYYNTGQHVKIEKDAASDCYAAIYEDEAEDNMDRRIKVVHYDGDHKVLNAAWFTNPQKDLKQQSLLGAVVDGNKRVFLATWAAKKETKKKSENGAHIFISRLGSSDSSFTHKALSYSEDYKETKGQIVYDRKNKRLVLLTNTLIEKTTGKNTYAVFTGYINPEDLSVTGVTPLSYEKMGEYISKVLKSKEEYNSLPLKIMLNGDNSLSVLSESTTNITNTYISSSGRSYSSNYAVLGDIGITHVSADGTEKDGCMIPKYQYWNGVVGTNYFMLRESGAQQLSNDHRYMSYEYIHTDNAGYVLFNKLPEVVTDHGKWARIGSKNSMNIDELSTVCYTIKDGIAKPSYIFGEPKGLNDSRACYIDGAYCDRENNTFVTVVSEQVGKNYESRIAWVRFE